MLKRFHHGTDREPQSGSPRSSSIVIPTMGQCKKSELIQLSTHPCKLDNDFLLNTPIDGIRTYLDYDDSCGLQRMELAKDLAEESFPFAGKGKTRARAKER